VKSSLRRLISRARRSARCRSCAKVSSMNLISRKPCARHSSISARTFSTLRYRTPLLRSGSSWKQKMHRHDGHGLAPVHGGRRQVAVRVAEERPVRERQRVEVGDERARRVLVDDVDLAVDDAPHAGEAPAAAQALQHLDDGGLSLARHRRVERGPLREAAPPGRDGVGAPGADEGPGQALPEVRRRLHRPRPAEGRRVHADPVRLERGHLVEDRGVREERAVEEPDLVPRRPEARRDVERPERLPVVELRPRRLRREDVAGDPRGDDQRTAHVSPRPGPLDRGCSSGRATPGPSRSARTRRAPRPGRGSRVA